MSCHCAPHQHLAVAAATANLRHLEWFHDHVRIEQTLFDGAATADGGVVRADPDAAGNGLTFRRAAAQRWRVTLRFLGVAPEPEAEEAYDDH